MRRWSLFFAILATGLLAFVLLRFVDLTTLGGFLTRGNLLSMTVGGVFFVLVNVVRGVRIARMTTRYVGVPVDMVSGVALATVTNLGNHVLPLRLGEVLYVAVSRTVLRVPLAASASILLTIRIYDLVALSFLVLVALTQTPALAAQWPIFAVLALVLLIVATQLDRLFGIADDAMQRLAPGKLARVFTKLREAIRFTRSKRFVASSLAYGVAVWVVQAVGFAVLLDAFGVHIALAPMVVATSLANLAAVLPLSALGTFGALEAGWTAGFVAMGVDATVATTSGLAMHIVVVAVNAIASALFVPWLISAYRARVTALGDGAGQTN